jgi:hypothetical protein
MTYTNLWNFSNCYGRGSDGGDPLSGSLAWMSGQPSTDWRTDLQRVTLRMYRRETTLWSPFLRGAQDCRGGSVGAKGHSRESVTVEPPSLSGSLSGNRSVLVAAVLAALVVAWAATNLVLGGEGLRYSSRTRW